MQNQINDIVTIVKDYRIDEGFGTSPERVQRWIEQFDKQDQEFILAELKNILDKRYYSKEKAKNFLILVIEHLKKEFEYQTVKEFLDDTIFLDLQPPKKSQKKLLEILGEVLKDKYGYDFNVCGNKQSKNFIYLDDILCTGNTLYRDIKTWIKTTDNSNTSYLENLKNDKIRLIFAYIFIHTKNYDKKLGQFYHNVDANFRNMIKTIEHIRIDKEYVFPIEENQPQIVVDYQTKITQQAEEQAKGKYMYPSEFYRDKSVPSKEDFFSSPENRIRFENIMLKKGVEILNASNTKKNNIRPLGYSLPSYKDFGFGTLCFTWRNVPNNTPLVFWYSSGEFFPLFEKNQTN